MKIFSIVVTYNPNIANLVQLCEMLLAYRSSVIIVDNSEGRSVLSDHVGFQRCEVIALGLNCGIAHAQNRGIELALRGGADVVVFFDQDSTPGAEFLPKLLSPVIPGKPGVVAPVCVDRATRIELPSFKLNWLGLVEKVYSSGHMEPSDVDLVISSGSAATAPTFGVAGPMDEDFFIDFVDFEWCLRCRSRGVPIRVVPAAVIMHSIGERSVDLVIMGGAIHSPARSYYKIRNCFLLFRKQCVPTLFAIRETIAALVQYVILLASVSNRKLYGKIFFRAIWHGMRGVAGKNPSPH